MRKSQELTKSQKQLLYLLPVLNDRQVAGMLSTLKKPARRVEKNDAYRQLMNMTGCAEAKEQLTAMLAAHRMSHIAESRSRTVKQPYFHAVFTGNPGCAKTTCARLYARALAQEGITKHDRFAELTRASLCGKYQGHTAQMVKEVFKQNKGGTIFIDEAYSLASDERDSFGAEAIDEIIVGLENDPGTVVIFAGYPEKMEQFLDANPGLRSRIPYRVRFCDYTADELLEISGKIAADNGFTITADAGEKLLGIFEKERQVRDFGNGRFCRSLVESAIRRKSVRLGVMDADDLSAYLDPARYSDEELFSLDGNCFTYSAAGEDHVTDQDRLLAALWLHPQTRFTTRDDFTTYNMVAAGLGISFNQRLIAQKWDRHAVAQVPFSPPQFIELGIAVPSMREASPAAKKLSACAVRCIRRLTDQGA